MKSLSLGRHYSPIKGQSTISAPMPNLSIGLASVLLNAELRYVTCILLRQLLNYHRIFELRLNDDAAINVRSKQLSRKFCQFSCEYFCGLQILQRSFAARQPFNQLQGFCLPTRARPINSLTAVRTIGCILNLFAISACRRVKLLRLVMGYLSLRS